MSIELTPEQTVAIEADGESPPQVFDPPTKTTYVLLPRGQNDRPHSTLGEMRDVRQGISLDGRCRSGRRVGRS